jgi:hypothetical protein
MIRRLGLVELYIESILHSRDVKDLEMKGVEKTNRTYNSSFRIRGQMAEIKRRIHNRWVIEIVLPALNQQDLEVRIGFGKASGCYTSRRSTTGEDDVHIAH